jgi:general stress protein YciG
MPTTTETPTTAHDTQPEIVVPRKLRGFARMDRERVREIARRGGKAAHEAGTAHEFTSEEARVAGRKGGIASQSARKQNGHAEARPTTENANGDTALEATSNNNGTSPSMGNA